MNSIARPVSADALLEDESGSPLTSIYLRDPDSKTLRLIGRDLAGVGLHFRNPAESETGSARPYLCLGELRCATCLGGRRPTPTFLAPVLYVPTRTPGVVSFGEANGPDSLRRQIAHLLRRPDYTQLVFELSLYRRKFTTKILRVLTEADDGEQFGLDVLQDLVVNGGLTLDAMVATVERLSNAEMLEESPTLRREIELRHPGLDVTTL